MSVYDFSVKTQEGGEVSLADYQGKVLLIVNTATGCGFTPQYDELQNIYEAYHAKGLEILDFPCNQFGGQAPGSNEEIHSFCTGFLISRDGKLLGRFEPTASLKKVREAIEEAL